MDRRDETLGYVRSHGGHYTLTPRVLELGMAYIQAADIWDITRPHIERLVDASETPEQKLLEEHLPLLLATASAISADWARIDTLPVTTDSTIQITT
jgi:hypothetical protein